MREFRYQNVLENVSTDLATLLDARRKLSLVHTQQNFVERGYTSVIRTRGGVENTRLEAKAKDTKKIRGQGQGQPFRGQTLSRPRTGMLEAKDQGHKRKCSPKKKGLHKKFSGNFHKKTFSKKIFQALHKILTIQKIVLSSSRGQANFRGQGQGLDFRGQGQGLQNVSSSQGRPRGLHL